MQKLINILIKEIDKVKGENNKEKVKELLIDCINFLKSLNNKKGVCVYVYNGVVNKVEIDGQEIEFNVIDEGE